MQWRNCLRHRIQSKTMVDNKNIKKNFLSIRDYVHFKQPKFDMIRWRRMTIYSYSRKRETKHAKHIPLVPVLNVQTVDFFLHFFRKRCDYYIF